MPRGRGIQGVVVVEVTRGSPAAAAGLQPGDAITAIDGQTLNSAQALVDAIEGRRPGEQVTLNVFRARDGNERQIEVTLGEHPDQDGRAYLGVTIGGSFRFFRGPGSEGGALPPGFDFGPGSFHLEVPLDQMPFHLDQLPFDLDQLPFHLDELPGGGQEFHQEFGSEDNSL
jgi:hypothetical protein